MTLKTLHFQCMLGENLPFLTLWCFRLPSMYDSYVPTCMTLSSVSSLCGCGLFLYKMSLLSASSPSLDTVIHLNQTVSSSCRWSIWDSQHSDGELIQCAAHKRESQLLLCRWYFPVWQSGQMCNHFIKTSVWDIFVVLVICILCCGASRFKIKTTYLDTLNNVVSSSPVSPSFTQTSSLLYTDGNRFDLVGGENC